MLTPTADVATIEKPAQRRAASIQGVLYAGAMCGTLLALAWLRGVPFTTPYQVLLGFLALVGYGAFRRFDLAATWSLAHPGSTGRRVLYAWLVLVITVLLAADLLRYSERMSRGLLVTWAVATPLVLFGLHLLVRRIAARYVPLVSMRRSAAIVFVNDTARELAQTLVRSSLYTPVGYFDDRPPARTAGGLGGLPLLAGTQRVADYVRRHGVQVVFVVLPEGSARRVSSVLDQLSDTTASIYYVPDLFVGAPQAQLSEVEGIPMMEVVETPFYGVDGVVKQLFDFGFATTALVMLAPVLLAIAIAVKLDSPGPVLFRQRRYGLDGRPFHVLKFRTMRNGAPNADQQQATRNDPRTTRVGRFLRRTSLDELPQFWNVLRGEMSVVGPRPHTVAHNEYYRRAVKRYMVRHKVKPGITGWAQVHGLRGETSQLEHMRERVRHDLDYVRHWSLLLDLEIIVRTVFVVLRDEHAY